MVSEGMAEAEILDAYPDLEVEDVREALRYAAEAVRERELPVSVVLEVPSGQRFVAEDLRSAGHDAIHIRDYSMQKATDLEVFARAAKEDRFLISADNRFWHVTSFAQRRKAIRHSASPRIQSSRASIAIAFSGYACDRGASARTQRRRHRRKANSSPAIAHGALRIRPAQIAVQAGGRKGTDRAGTRTVGNCYFTLL
jgi:uncharacterized protein (DUF433 family)